MKNPSNLSLAGIVLVAVIALVCGAAGGAVVAGRESSTKIITERIVSPTSSSSPVAVSSNPAAPESWVQVAGQAAPAVVTIVNQQQPQQDIFGNLVAGGTAEGSGFIVDRRGDIVTNNHVVTGAQSLTVVFSNGRKAVARLVRADPTADLAVVKVD